jgi:hypothetical protein
MDSHHFHPKGHCWETSLGCKVKLLESRDAGGSQFISIEPCYGTHHIDRSGNTKMLQMRFGKANITGAAHAKGTHTLPRSWLRCPPAGHTLWQRLVSEASDGRLEALHVGQTARTVRGRRLYFFSERVQWLSRGQTPQSMPRELDLNDLILPVVDGRRPAHTRMALGTGRLLLVPIKAKLTDIDPLLGVGLPFHIRTPGSNHAECRSVAGSRPGSGP